LPAGEAAAAAAHTYIWSGVNALDLNATYIWSGVNALDLNAHHSTTIKSMQQQQHIVQAFKIKLDSPTDM
jgi:hypothetical protein